MKFSELYSKTISYFPSEIDISDGEYIEETGGFYFGNLSNTWHDAEPLAQNEWESLLIWTIFGYLHRKAKSRYATSKSKNMILSEIINLEELGENYLSDLQEEGYEGMLAEYIVTNRPDNL